MTAEEEFELLMQHIDGTILVTETNSEGESTISCILEDVFPYESMYVTVFKKYKELEGQELPEGRNVPFIGAVAGVRRVSTPDGQVLYENPGLRYEKPHYDIFNDEADAALVERMRIEKFGPGYQKKIQPIRPDR